MSIYENNLNALRQSNPQLVDLIHHTEDDYSVKVFPTPYGPTAVVKNQDTDWLIHSRENPTREANFFLRAIVEQNAPNQAVAVFWGLGMGYYLEALLGYHNPFRRFIIVIENNVQLFKKFLENRILMLNSNQGPVNVLNIPNVRFFVGIPPDQLYKRLVETLNDDMFQPKTSFTSFSFIEHPVLIRFNKAYYKEIEEQTRRALNEVASLYGNDPEDSWLGMGNMLLNLDTIAENPGVIATFKKFINVPAVIVATGPSLDKNIHLLPKIKDRCVFFAADASLRRLLDDGIIPDMVTSLERNLSTANHFLQIPEDKKHLMKDIWLCACPVVKPEVYRAWEGKNTVLYRDFSHFKWIKVIKGLLNTGKAVTNMAWKIAEAMGCNPIVLVGQDLAFAPDGKSHHGGADHARDGLKKSILMRDKQKVMGNEGKMLDTLGTWMGMLKRFQFDIASNPSVTCINATEGGAFIPGTKIMTLQQVIDEYMSDIPNQEYVPMQDRINKLLIYPTPEQIQEDKNTIYQIVEEGREFLNWSKSRLRHATGILEQAFDYIDEDQERIEESKAILKTIHKIYKDMVSKPEWYLICAHVVQSWTLGFQNRLQEINNLYTNKKEREVVILLSYYEQLHGLIILLDMISDGIEKWSQEKPN